MSESAYDAIVVGTGIVGAACAAELSRRGMRTLLIGQDMIGSGATAAGMGHIVVMDDSDAQFSLTRYSQQLWKKLKPELPVDVEYDECGTIWIATDEEEMREVERKRDYYNERGVPAKALDASELYELESNVAPGMLGGLLVPKTASCIRRARPPSSYVVRENRAPMFISESESNESPTNRCA